MSSRSLTSTSYAILCLISMRSWSTYELAQLMRALAALHLAARREQPVRRAEAARRGRLRHGRRERGTATASARSTRSPRGDTRRSATWLARAVAVSASSRRRPCASSSATSARRRTCSRPIARVAADAEEPIEEFSTCRRRVLRGDGRFPERIHVNALLPRRSWSSRHTSLRDGRRWAAAEVERWRDTDDARRRVGVRRRSRRAIDGRASATRLERALHLPLRVPLGESRRLSMRSLPRASASSTLTRPSLK